MMGYPTDEQITGRDDGRRGHERRDDRTDLEKAKAWVEENTIFLTTRNLELQETVRRISGLITQVRTDAQYNAEEKTLNVLRDEAFRNSKEHGFHEREKSMGEYVALIHSEVSEAFEDYREGHEPRDYWYLDAGERTSKPDHIDAINGKRCLNKPCGIPSEIADVIIRCLDFSGAHGIDIERAVVEKMAFNEMRPHKHGKRL